MVPSNWGKSHNSFKHSKNSFLFVQVMIHLDGDNDVGGEGEPVTRENIKRFREHFGFKPGLNPVGSRVDIIVLDVLTMNASEVLKLQPPTIERCRVGVSHVPVIPLAAGYSQFSKTALEHVKPDVVFSAHHHIGFDQAYSRHTGKSVYQGTKFTKGSSLPVRTNLTHDRFVIVIILDKPVILKRSNKVNQNHLQGERDRA